MGRTERKETTPKQHVRKAKDLAERIDELEGVESAHVDDWGPHSNFQMAIRLPGSKMTTTKPGTLYDLDVDLRSLRPQVKALFENTDFYFDGQYGNGGFVTPQTESYEVIPGEYESGHESCYMMVHFRHP